MLFDADRSDATPRVIFCRAFRNPPSPIAWVNDTQIAVMEIRPGRCPYYGRYGYIPTNLAIIDLHGGPIKRGPCMAGVLAGPRGLVYLQYMPDSGVRALLVSLLDRPGGADYFSSDRGRTWRRGTPASEDGNGGVYYWPDYMSNGTLLDGANRVVTTNALARTRSNLAGCRTAMLRAAGAEPGRSSHTRRSSLRRP